MTIETGKTELMLWHDVIKQAERQCAINLEIQLEAYLVSLIFRYANKPEVMQQVLATTFLEAMNSSEHLRMHSLQTVGDQCLLYAGLFPQVANKRHVKITYFVDLGRSAYAHISEKTNDLFGSLAEQFVALMDVLQSIRSYHELMPLEAYEQWHELGSKRAYRILRSYRGTGVHPLFRYRK